MCRRIDLSTICLDFDLETFLKYRWIEGRKYTSVGSFISTRQEYPNLLQRGIWVSAQRSRSIYDLSFSEASRYPGKRTNVYHHRWRDGEIYEK